MSYVYFIAASGADMVKIGFAANPWKRLSKIQSDCPHELTILAIETGTQAREAQLHRQFADERLRGEWFKLSGKIATYTASLPTPIRRRRAPLGGALGAWMHENDHTVSSAAKLFGLSAGTISRICAGKDLPRRDAVLRIFEQTGGKVTPNGLYGIAHEGAHSMNVRQRLGAFATGLP